MTRIVTRPLIGAAALLFLVGAAAPRAIDLPGDRLFPESVSIAKDGSAYMGSMNGGVLKVSLKTGKAEQWIKPNTHGIGSVFGVLADARNHMLWVCSNNFTARGAGVIVAGQDKSVAVKGFDLQTGAIKVNLPFPGDHGVCNDFAVAKDGSVYITDTGAPRILRWRPGAEALETWLENPVFDAQPGGGGLDGIALAGDGNLYVNNVRDGDLFRIALTAGGRPGAVTKLTLSRPLVSPDGMRPISGMDLALAEGEGRITQVTIMGDRAEVRTLADNVTKPTGVAVQGSTLWYVQGNLSFLFQPPKEGGPKLDLPFRLTPIALGR